MNARSSSEVLLTELQSYYEAFAAEKLTAYTNEIEQTKSAPNSPKEINDPIWATIKLHPIEVAILDSPLLQRMRFIRQLGVVHWVYPGAIHTRFEHTLGVLYQTQQIIAAINDAAPPGEIPIKPRYASLLRLCAILHDVGHGAFSHVSEHALERSDQLRSAQAKFSIKNRYSKVYQLSELAAYFIVGSEAFHKFLSTLLKNLSNALTFAEDNESNAKTIVEKIQKTIIGQSIHDQVPLMHEVISGPLDADKLDYFVRDSKMAGIPSVLDISRLTQKITVQPVQEKMLPPQIGKHVTAGQPQYFLFGLKWSGASVLDELHLARILLYAKIYRHPKVLAAEAMIEALFDMLVANDDSSIIKIVNLAYQLTDDQMLWKDPEAILNIAGISNPSENELAFTEDILRRLRERRLFVKALGIRASYPDDEWKDHSPQKKGLERLVEDLSNPVESRAFCAELVSEVSSIASLLPESVPSGFNVDLIPQSIVVASKPKLTGGAEIDRSFIFQGDKPITYRDISNVNRHAWADAYDFSVLSAIVFCPREIGAITFVGAEKIIRKKYNVILPPSVIDLSKQSLEKIDFLKRKLQLRNFYHGAPFDLRPTPKRLSKADVSNALESLAQKFESIDEPPTLDDSRRPKSLRDRTEYWLSQFETSEHIECAIEVLHAIKILRREDTKNTLSQFVEKHPEFIGATILRLGDGKDSSSILGYQSQDMSDLFPKVKTLKEAAEQNIDSPVVFLDDFIGSGNQVRDMLGNGFDEDSLKKVDLDEQRDLFEEKERDYLRSRKVAFVFVAGWAKGVSAAEQATNQLGLDATVFAYLGEEDIPFAFEGILDSKFEPEIVQSFKERCETIGKALLTSEEASSDKINSRALGYGNRAMLLVSSYNVPTQVLTCLWKSGDIKEFKWKNLLSRRKKK
jgi:HD superfamily phosphohydrolase